MTADPSILAVMAEFLANHPTPPRRELRVSEEVWRFLFETYATAIRKDWAAAMPALPILVSAKLTGGQWQILEDGEVTSSGDMAPAPEDMTVSYSPITGWIAIRSDLIDPLGPNGLTPMQWTRSRTA